MNGRVSAPVVAFAVAAALAGCEDARRIAWETTPTSLAVTIVEGETAGTNGEPLPIPDGPLSFAIDIALLGGAGEGAVPIDGEVELSARPGRVLVDGGGTVRVTGGVAQGVSLRIEGAFGETRIWARELATGVIGVSDAIRLRNPSISQLQGTGVCSPMEDEFVVIDSGDLVVTNVTTNGMNVVDVSTLDEKGRPAPGSSVYVYSFSRPMSLPSCVEDEEADTLACSQHSFIPVQVCDRVRRVSGGVNAFNGFTELNFPSWELAEWVPSEGPCPVPEPFDLTGLSCADLYGAGPLQYEGALVRVRNVEVDCDDGEACYEDDKYVKYGEWWINLKGGSCKTGKLYVVSHIAAPDFDPFLPENARISSITGTLKPLYFSPSKDKCEMGGDFTWIVEPRCPDDIVVEGEPRPIKESCLPK